MIYDNKLIQDIAIGINIMSLLAYGYLSFSMI